MTTLQKSVVTLIEIQDFVGSETFLSNENNLVKIFFSSTFIQHDVVNVVKCCYQSTLLTEKYNSPILFLWYRQVRKTVSDNFRHCEVFENSLSNCIWASLKDFVLFWADHVCLPIYTENSRFTDHHRNNYIYMYFKNSQYFEVTFWTYLSTTRSTSQTTWMWTNVNKMRSPVLFTFLSNLSSFSLYFAFTSTACWLLYSETTGEQDWKYKFI